jgi:hypothetical protein
VRRPDVERIQYDAMGIGWDRIENNTAQLIDYISALEIRIAVLEAMLREGGCRCAVKSK